MKIFEIPYTVKLKKCLYCENNKESTDFNWNSTKSDKRNNICKSCLGIIEYEIAQIKQSLLKIKAHVNKRKKL